MITIRDEIRRLITPIDDGAMPVVIAELWMSMSALIFILTQNQLLSKEGNLEAKKTNVKSAKDFFTDTLMTLSGNNFIDYSILHLTAYRFLNWYLDQDSEKYSDDDRAWWEYASVIYAFNDFVKENENG